MAGILLPEPIVKRDPSCGYAYGLKDGPAPVAYSDPASRRTGIDRGSMSASFTITQEIGDRVGDVIEARGLYLGNFKANAIGYYDHKQSPPYVLPIGRWKNRAGDCTLKRMGNGWEGTIFFSQKTAQAEEIFALVDEEILVSASIGFNPMVEPERRSMSEDNPHSLQAGYYFPRIDLLEISVVGVPALPTATLVRSLLSKGQLAGKPLTQQVKSLLLPLAEPRKAWSPGIGDKSLAALAKKCAESCECGDDMSKKWKNRPAKAMNESSSTEGGATVPAEQAAEDKVSEPTHDAGKEAMHGRIKEYTSAIMEHHKDDAHPEGPHNAYYHGEKAAVHHEHHPEADAGHLALVKADLGQIEGVREVHQHHTPPDGEGWEKAYMGAEETNEGAERHAEEGARETPETEEELEKKPRPEEQNVPVKRLAWTLEKRIAVGRGIHGFFATMLGGDPKQKSALEECVSAKIPKIADDHPEMEADQREAVAYSMCGEKLFGSAWLKTLAKALLDEDPNEPERSDGPDDTEEVPEGDVAAEDEAPELPMSSGDEPATGEGAEAVEQQDEAVPEETGAGMPHGAEAAQRLIGYCEECLEMAEPETAAFFKDICGQIKEWAAKRYPDMAFGDEGVETAAEGLHAADHTAEEDEESREETAEATAEYRGFSAGRFPTGNVNPRSYFAKRYLHKRGLGVIKDASEHLDDMADHFGGVAEDEDRGGSDRRHARTVKSACAMHSKALGELHREMTAGPEPQSDESAGGVPEYEVNAMQPGDADWDDVEQKLNGVGRRLNGLSELAYRFTGKRV